MLITRDCSLSFVRRYFAVTTRAHAIPKGVWRLQLLSDHPLLPLEPSKNDGGRASDPSPASAKGRSSGARGDNGAEEGQEEGGSTTTVVPCFERVVYGGEYVPNKYLYLFR